MKSLGVVRKVDKLRRVAIPVEVRKLLNLKDGDSLEFFKDDEGVIIRKHIPSLKE
ncbi:MAG: AbrB/MazE/SpoVT family DNA-binding domain-containing protein [Clostridium sp.]|uniref:AbrB/MazE/SpoVT family DNA-binding domain-containing protein n=1 Tax=Clostridium sp. TaxID=1506 RepID=UPI00399A2BC7